MDALVAGLGRTDAQKFISLVADDGGDYTKWRKYLFHGLTIEELSSEATEHWKKNNPNKRSI